MAWPGFPSTRGWVFCGQPVRPVDNFSSVSLSYQKNPGFSRTFWAFGQGENASFPQGSAGLKESYPQHDVPAVFPRYKEKRLPVVFLQLFSGIWAKKIFETRRERFAFRKRMGYNTPNRTKKRRRAEELEPCRKSCCSHPITRRARIPKS